MRLTNAEKEAIAQAAHDVFAPGTLVLLFGSRVDDSKRGGDIDLLIETPQAMTAAEVVDHRTRFAARLYRTLDEQRIDVVIATHQEQDPRSVVDTARRSGILLAQV